MKTAEQILDEFYSTEEPLQVGVDFYYRNEVLNLMNQYAEEYHKQKMAEIMPGDEEIKIEAQKYWQHSTGLLSTWFEKGALWFKSLLTQEEK